ncbi:hypothetical protein BH09BAC2_BH09BAC2_15500 [soil metagenome]
MTIKPINSSIKNHFEMLLQKADEKAVSAFHKNYQVKAKKLDHFNRLKLLIEEGKKLDTIIKNHDYPYYIQNHSSKDWLLTQFASRTFLLNIDESEAFIDAVYIGKYRGLISEAKTPLKDEIPQYSYDKFINNDNCPYFSNFNHYHNLSEEDYYKIKDWQSDALIKVVEYEYKMLVRKIQAHCKTLSNPIEFIVSEKEKIENNLDNARESSVEIKKILADLFIFRNESLDIFNDALLVENFKIYKSEQIVWKDIKPQKLAPLLTKIDKKSKRIISNEQTIFYTINKVADWFELVINGQALQAEIIEPDWDALLNEVKEKAATEVALLTEKVEDYVYNPDLSKDEIKDYLIEQLEVYRHKFNAFEKKYFFHILREEKQFILRRMFITNSFFGNDLKGQLEGIYESTIIHEISWLIVQVYNEIFETHKIDYPNKDEAHFEIMSLLHQMVLDKELYEDLHNSLDDFMEHFHQYFLPIEIHFQNQREAMSNLFRKAIDRLQNILDDAEGSNKILFLQSRLKQLRQRELQIKEFRHDKDFNKKDYKYSKLFKEFLQIEAEFINQTKDINVMPAIAYGKQVLLPAASTQTFDTILPNEKGAFVLQMLEDLGITVNNKSTIGERQKGCIRGIVESLKDAHILPNQSLEFLNNLIADKIGLVLKSKIDWSKTSDAYLTKGKKYISENYNR